MQHIFILAFLLYLSKKLFIQFEHPTRNTLLLLIVNYIESNHNTTKQQHIYHKKHTHYHLYIFRKVNLERDRCERKKVTQDKITKMVAKIQKLKTEPEQ